MLDKSMRVEEYTPCRIHEHYSDENDEIEFISFKGDARFKLKGLGRFIWLLLDGKNTIQAIADQLHAKLSTSDEVAIKSEVIVMLKMLAKRNAIVINWNPLYKSFLSQEV